MPKRKQKSSLRTRDASGVPLSRSKRWHSAGIDRQVARGDDAFSQSLPEARDPALARQLDRDLDWREQAEWTAYLEQNGWDDRHLDEFAVSLGDIASRNSLGDVAPTELQDAWLNRHALPELAREDLESRIEKPWHADSPLARQVKALIPSGGLLDDLYQLCAAENRAKLASSILYFAPLWVRSPLTFRGGSLRALIDHLFVVYPVPGFLYRAWLSDRDDPGADQKWQKWFLCFARGGSLFALSSISPDWSVHRRFQHHFSRIEDAPSLESAVRMAELERLGVTAPASDWLLNHYRYQQDISARWHDGDVRGYEHWCETACWLQRNREALDDQTADRILGWGADNHWRDAQFSWRGRSVAACVRRARAEQYVRINVPSRWPNHDMDWTDGELWSIVELNTTEELKAEGEALSHCVGQYSAQCASGASAIFSLRREGTRGATIELDLSNNRVLQARGSNNRALTREEANAVQQWLDSMASSSDRNG